jgi:hypothetical protein
LSRKSVEVSNGLYQVLLGNEIVFDQIVAPVIASISHGLALRIVPGIGIASGFHFCKVIFFFHQITCYSVVILFLLLCAQK